jgi:hypothetical protein
MRNRALAFLKTIIRPINNSSFHSQPAEKEKTAVELNWFELNIIITKKLRTASSEMNTKIFQHHTPPIAFIETELFAFYDLTLLRRCNNGEICTDTHTHTPTFTQQNINPSTLG